MEITRSEIKSAKKFGGRPRREPEPGERVHLGFRVTPELKRRVEQAAERSGRSQSQEAEFRIERSFDRQDLLSEVLTLAYGERNARVLMMIGSQMVRGGEKFTSDLLSEIASVFPNPD